MPEVAAADLFGVLPPDNLQVAEAIAIQRGARDRAAHEHAVIEVEEAAEAAVVGVFLARRLLRGRFRIRQVDAAVLGEVRIDGDVEEAALFLFALAITGGRHTFDRCRQLPVRKNPQTAGLFGDERSEEHTSELQSQSNLVCRLLLEKKKRKECY